MFRVFQFLKKEQEFIHISVPKHLRGKLVEIVIQEKAPDADTKLDETEEEQLANKAAELRMIDNVRNQLKGWDM